MTVFRVFLLAWLAAVVGYTGLTIAGHGLGLFPVFFGAIAAGDWPGQFNLDFLGMLILSALWVSWREGYGLRGLVLGLLAFNLGSPFLCGYLLVLAARHGGDLRAMLVGAER
ncbi:MAG: hypothetical protein JSS36_05765 [Proteobacteria bacterium]|nr:hypothetical protein [Pseudomonadota bacterium]